MTEQYETDEEEFMEKEVSATTLESKKARNTAKQETRLSKGKRSNPAHSQGYQLAYINLWWNGKRREEEIQSQGEQRGVG